jgi:hypothetical protein
LRISVTHLITVSAEAGWGGLDLVSSLVGGRFVSLERREQDRGQPTLVAGGPICGSG